MTRTTYEKVREFHEAFGHPVRDKVGGLTWQEINLRMELIREEFSELLEAAGFSLCAEEVRKLNLGSDEFGTWDTTGVADALGDLDYVIAGAALTFGIPHDRVVDEIHRSNMTKLGPDGKPIVRADGKILKGDSYEPPQLGPILYDS